MTIPLGVRYHLGFKVSQVVISVPRCQLCHISLEDVVIDSPIKGIGTWCYQCPDCARTNGLKDIGTIHRNDL